MFEQLDEKKLKIAIQKKVAGKVIKKKAGRPQSPEKAKYHFKMPIVLHHQLRKKATETGITISAFVCMALKEKLDQYDSIS